METLKLILLIVGIIVAWVVVMFTLLQINAFIFRTLSHWNRAVDAYGIDEPEYPATLPGQSAGFALLAYARNSVHVGLGQRGLQISGKFVFRWFVKPVLVPWGDVRVGTWTNILGESMSVTFVDARGVRIGFSPKSTENILSYIDELSPGEIHPGLVKLRDGYRAALEREGDATNTALDRSLPSKQS